MKSWPTPKAARTAITKRRPQISARPYDGHWKVSSPRRWMSCSRSDTKSFGNSVISPNRKRVRRVHNWRCDSRAVDLADVLPQFFSPLLPRRQVQPRVSVITATPSHSPTRLYLLTNREKAFLTTLSLHEKNRPATP